MSEEMPRVEELASKALRAEQEGDMERANFFASLAQTKALSSLTFTLGTIQLEGVALKGEGS
ncbi:hypothetical protein ACF07Q_28665 [Nocardiopsis dassonvillei]|uniref:hypothetical protein n=1 Tax=Nocardiopsis dassonvillei TaxID=2014 RepID=UPI003700B1DF